MKLYYSKGACSLVVRIIIHEIGTNCEFESVDLNSKRTENGNDFFKINPKGAVPALMTDQKDLITENSVILQYLADTYNNDQLLPAIGQLKRYRVLEWLNYISTELHKGCSPLFNPNLSSEIKETFFIPALKNKLNYVEKHLEQYPFLVGDSFTLPDAYIFVILSWLSYFKISLTTWPHLATYYEKLTKRPSVHQALKEEGLTLETTH